MDSPDGPPPPPLESAVYSPPPDAQNQTALPRNGAVTGSALQSPSHSEQATATPTEIETSARVEEEAVTGSAVRSQPHSKQVTATPTPKETNARVEEEAVTGSSVRSPSHSPGKQVTPTPTPNETSARVVEEAVTGSSVHSRPHLAKDQTAALGPPVRSPPPPPLKDSYAEDQNAPFQETMKMLLLGPPRVVSVEDEVAVLRSPVKSPPNSSPKESEALALERDSIGREEAVTGSSVRPPEVKVEVNDSEVESVAKKKEYNYLQHKESPVSSPVRVLTVGSILHLPPGDMMEVDPFQNGKAIPSTAVVENKMEMEEMMSEAEGEKGGGGKGLVRAYSGTLRQPALRIAAVWFRILALILSLISFTVMAAIRTSGWVGDSFDRYIEFRYCLSANVIAFVYSLFQVYVQVHHKIKNKRIMSRGISYYFDFSMDQILAYLLMSASSSAASRNFDWVSNFGSDKFTDGINGAIAVSFLAFLALAFSAIISSYKFFTWICL